MTPEIINSLIENLEQVRLRPGMWMGRITVEAACGFNGGIACACAAFGMNQTIQLRDQATRNRGWVFTSTGGVNMMEAKGLTEAQIVDELLLIEIEMLKIYAKTLEDDSANINL